MPHADMPFKRAAQIIVNCFSKGFQQEGIRQHVFIKSTVNLTSFRCVRYVPRGFHPCGDGNRLLF